MQLKGGEKIDVYISWVEILYPVISAILLSAFSYVVHKLTSVANKIDDDRRKDKVLENFRDRALQQLLKVHIMDVSDKYIERGCISRVELEQLGYLFEPYEGLGGNDIAHANMELCRQLPRTKKETDEY